jgi:hypothetical protein
LNTSSLEMQGRGHHALREELNNTEHQDVPVLFTAWKGRDLLHQRNEEEKSPYICHELGCRGEQVQWLHEVFGFKGARTDLTECKEEGTVNVTMGKREKGWPALDES